MDGELGTEFVGGDHPLQPERIHQRLAEGYSHTVDYAIDIGRRRVGSEPGGEGAVERGQGEWWGGETLDEFGGVLKLGLHLEELIGI